MVLEHHAGVHVALVDRNALRLVLLAEVACEYIVVAVSMRVLAVLAHFRAFDFLAVYVDLLLLAAWHFIVIAVVLLILATSSFYVVIGQLGLDQVHLRTKLGRLTQL